MLFELTAAVAQPFPGYISLPSQDFGAVADETCIRTMWADPAVNKLLCDRAASCQVFSDRTLKRWDTGAIVDTYMSVVWCTGAQTGANMTGGCPTSGQNISYWRCAGSAGDFAAQEQNPLPPFLMAQTCDNNPLCVGFTVNKVGTHGSMLFAKVDATTSYNLKLPPAPPPPLSSIAQLHTKRAMRARPRALGIDPPQGFRVFDFNQLSFDPTTFDCVECEVSAGACNRPGGAGGFCGRGIAGSSTQNLPGRLNDQFDCDGDGISDIVCQFEAIGFDDGLSSTFEFLSSRDGCKSSQLPLNQFDSTCKNASVTAHDIFEPCMADAVVHTDTHDTGGSLDLHDLEQYSLDRGAGYAMRAFHFKSPNGDSNYRYDALCVAVPAATPTTRYTACQDIGGSQFLDRHNVACAAGEAITSFQFIAEGCSNGQMRYQYSCAQVAKGPAAPQQQTFCGDVGSAFLSKLDQLLPSCGPGHVLQQFQLVHASCEGSNEAYTYTCVPMQQSEPLDGAALGKLCDTAPWACSHFTNTGWIPPGANSTEEDTRVFKFAPTQNVTFLRDDLAGCAVTTGECGGTFFNCSGYGLMQKPTLLGTYDLSANLLAAICQSKGCDGFTSGRDGQGGTLFKFGRNASRTLTIRLEK